MMPKALRFGGFEFHPRSGELIGGGERVRLEPQPAKALTILASRPGQVVTREELQQEIWPAEVFVDFERGLAYCIRRIRLALDDSAAAPRFVETLPKRGYRFLPAVAAVFEDTPASIVATASGRRGGGVGRRLAWSLVGLAVVLAGGGLFIRARRAAEIPTVAVTRFDNETGSATLDREAQVLDDTLVERLARQPGRWSVIGNAAILRAPRPLRNLEAIASSLHADFIVLGQILPADKGLTVLTHLIRARDQRHLWVGRFAVSPPLTAELADRIAASVSRAAAERIGGPG